MQLMLYIGNDLIEAVPLDRSQLPVPGYLGKVKRELKDKHEALLLQAAERPEFLVMATTPAAEPVTKAG